MAVDVGFFTGKWKVLRVIAIIMGIGTVIFSIFSAVMVGINGGGWDDLMRATGGRLFDSDRDLSLTVEKLKFVQENPNSYDSIDVDNMKSRIFTDLGILAIFFYLFVTLFAFIWNKAISTGEPNIGFGAYIIIIFLVIMIMSFLHVGWLVYESKVINGQGYTDGIHIPEAIPYYGIYNFATNYKVLSTTGTKDINLFNEVIQTNETINPNVITIIDRG